MKWCRVEVDGEIFYGRMDGQRIIRVDGNPITGETRDCSQHFGLDQVTWLPPVIPPTFYAVGYNYPDHIEHAGRVTGKEPPYPKRPEVGYRANGALIGHNQTIIKPSDVEGRFELEAEVVAVIGKRLRNCSRDEAYDGIFGWTVGNDVSARAWQYSDRTFWRAKNADTFKPMGPWIETEVNPDTSTTTVAINDTIEEQFATGNMVFDALDYITEISRYITLSPGDVIWMGADGATEMAVGDQIAISISGIGTLCNDVELGPTEY